MQRFLLVLLLVVTAGVGLVLPLWPSEAHVLTHTLTQTPVSGQLAAGGTFRGRLTIQELTVDAQGQLAASGVLTGTATTTPGTTTRIAAHPFTAAASLLDVRGTCTTVVLDLAPVFLAPLEQDVTLAPVILHGQAARHGEHLVQSTLCALARLQEKPPEGEEGRVSR